MKKLFLLFTLLVPAISFAQNYSINWFKVSGGGSSAGGTYQDSGTIGQQDAGGPLTGGSYSVTGGFWALISVAQTPGAPTFYISRSGSTVTVFWQAVPGWTLQQNNNLTVPAAWQNNSGVTTANGTNYLNLPNPTGNSSSVLPIPKTAAAMAVTLQADVFSHPHKIVRPCRNAKSQPSPSTRLALVAAPQAEH